MDKLTKIKEKLDEIYKEYKNNKSQLNDKKTKLAAKLIVEMTFSSNVNPSDVALELARFSADVVNIYFDSLTKSVTIPLEVLDDILKEWRSTYKDAKLSRHYVLKYTFAITSIMKCYKDGALKSIQLPCFVAFIAQFAVKSSQNKEKFQKLINNTNGGIYMLDYTNIRSSSLTNIWNATKTIFPDLSKAKYESFITEWGKKYGFINGNVDKAPVAKDNAVKIKKLAVSNEMSTEQSATISESNSVVSIKKDKIVSASADSTTNKRKDEIMTTSNEIENNTAPASKTTPEKETQNKMTTKNLYNCIKRDMAKEQDAIITAFTDMITPIGKAFESIQGEISKSRKIGAENVTLRARIEDLERQLSDQRSRLQAANQSLRTAKTENDELKRQISDLENQKSELDDKLNNAYAINSRESSLEAEKIRSELKKYFAFLYEDWLEYEFSNVSEENYESLQAIIKKVFRSLERNGIDFKGNN